MADSGLGLPTLKHIRVVLLKGTKLANKWSGGIISSPVALADLPKNAARSEPVRTLSIEEVRAISQKAEQSSDILVAAIIKVIAATGLGRGEVAALRWSDVLFLQSRRGSC